MSPREIDKKSRPPYDTFRGILSVEESSGLCRSLIRAESENPPGREKNVAEVIIKKLDELGIPFEMDQVLTDRSNVYGRLAGTERKPVLLLSGHMDVVPAGDGWSIDPYGAILQGDRIFGRGAVDMKGGLAAMLLALELLQRSKVQLRGDIVLVAVVDEQIGESGIKKYMQERGEGDFAIVGEPTDLTLCTCQKGELVYEVETRGMAAHSSLPAEGVNAISKMAKVVHAIEEYSKTLVERRHPLLGSPTVSIGTIEGGVSASIVPSSCRMTLDRRTLPSEPLETVDAELERIIDEVNRRDIEAKASVRRILTAFSMETQPNSVIVQAAREASAQLFERDLMIGGFRACSDAGYLSPRIPTVLYGPGQISRASKPDEFVSINQVLEASLMYAGIAFQVLQ